MSTQQPATPDLYWQVRYREKIAEVELLDRQRKRVKSYDLRDALWSGAYELKKHADKHVECAHNSGLLLTMFVADKATRSAA